MEGDEEERIAECKDFNSERVKYGRYFLVVDGDDDMILDLSLARGTKKRIQL